MLLRRRHELLLCRRLFSSTSRTTFFRQAPSQSTPASINGAVKYNTKPEADSNGRSSHGNPPQPFPRADSRARLSSTWLPSGGMTTAEEKKDEAHSFLVKAGYIRQAHSGIYHNLPFGMLVQEKISQLITTAMMNVGGIPVSLSSVTSEALWKRSGRIEDSLEKDEHELLAIKDRRNSGFLLSPTHEEEMTALVASATKSYKEFPLRLYQFSRKYRDELRPRQGLLRTKEFLMKDLYTFDLTEEAALQTYQIIRDSYRALFHQLEVPFMEVEASSGNMGGNLSHEFHFPSPAGEDTLLSCESCGHAVNEEVLEKNRDDAKSCPNCGSKNGASHRSIEVGHTFHLGTRYSKPLNLAVGVPNCQIGLPESPQLDTNKQPMVPIQMGCHGIGVSRLVGAIATMTADKKGLCWPPLVAPFHVVIICNGRSSPLNQSGPPDEVVAYDALKDIGCETYSNHRTKLTRIIDDRDKPLAWKLNDAELVGYPIAVVLGKNFKQTGKYEIQCRSRPELSQSSHDLGATVCQILNALSPPQDSPGWINWKKSAPKV